MDAAAAWMEQHATIDCTPLAARITPAACASYRKAQTHPACERCPHPSSAAPLPRCSAVKRSIPGSLPLLLGRRAINGRPVAPRPPEPRPARIRRVELRPPAPKLPPEIEAALARSARLGYAGSAFILARIAAPPSN